ncbi:MAG: hypothetical protein QOK25_1704, partial [Thermoleophilaceae bacterium]|nr:hypothetical protein [Thermoleophilaceae bacterium]
NVNYGDFNGDGNVDLVTANDGTSSTDILLGVGDGTFAPSQSFVLPSANVTVSVADINVDGKPDLVFNSGEILLNTTPTPTPPPPPPGGLSPPVIQKTSNVKPVSGSVRIKRPGSNAFVNLTGAAQIPLGSTIDASKGRVTTAIARKGGGTDAADFYEGQFVVSQDATGLATLTMDGGSFKSCKKKKVKHALHSAKKRRSIRHLWGSGVGRFRTRGRHSSATVRGTIWDVEDRCDGTLTKVVKGTVSVRAFKKKKTVTVKAGKSYLARK